MINKKKAAILVTVLVVLAVAAMIILFKGQAGAQAQQAEVRPSPAVVGQPMPDFTLPLYQGGALTLSSLRGKNVLILFPRGYAAENTWCTICNYRYVELAELEKGTILAPFPILVDGERMLSKGLGLFQTEWTGSKVDQNIPSVYIIDANGVLQFKYLGQNTVDRPGYDYLFKVLEVINGQE